MIARCARCQGTFTTDRFGLQTCPHCGSELLLADPNAPATPPGQPAQAETPAAAPPQAPPQEPPQAPAAAAGGLPPPPPPPPGGYGPPQGGWPPPPPGGPDAYPPPGGAPGELPAPFAERARRGFFGAFFETWKLVAIQPQEFFRRVRIDQTGSAILFGVIASTVGNLVAGLYNYLSGQQALVAMQEMMANVPEDQARVMRMYAEFLAGGGTLAQVVLTPILTLIFMYVGAGILHLVLMLFRGAKRPFEATLTVVAYANGLNLLLAVPVCGGLLAFVWFIVVLILGLGEAQRCGSGKATAVVLAPAALACLCCCAALGISAPAFMKMLEGAAQQGTQTTNL